jgi:hypothetical protein
MRDQILLGRGGGGRVDHRIRSRAMGHRGMAFKVKYLRELEAIFDTALRHVSVDYVGSFDVKSPR